MYGHLLELGLTAKQAEQFMYLISTMVNGSTPSHEDTKAFQKLLKALYDFGK